ncbi:AfsR/SARP family transcriptional regulator [Streptomyces sp. DH37]|uniref:AfsR/SARP family transcriptional regulator n=1 Tax=Streptomyces sp. DH37 TaxID=3040122 RepID=UPI0024428569|nr:AfsR/SARP family transcriptional regulator [Streptomyces sp. DH37]MDG9700726.1 AfsR/SARP family transcriptional regulator [Streptomyces sp. DH37]
MTTTHSTRHDRHGPDPGVRFGLLGPVEVRRAGVPVHPGPPQRRVLLVRLLLEDGGFVSTDRLCEDLWAGRPPTGALSSLHAHISRLRSALEPGRTGRGSGELLVRGGGGYALRAAGSARDSVRFERALDRARRLLEDGRPEEAREEVDRALALWRGPALADAADHPFAAEEVWRLEELRATGRELRVDALLAQGRFGQAVAAARVLTDRHPLRESAWTLLLRSLRLAGRPAEAARQYDRVHRLLLGEPGLEPGPALRRQRTAPPRPPAPPAPRRAVQQGHAMAG